VAQGLIGAELSAADEKADREIIQRYRDRRRAIRAKFGAGTHEDARAWFNSASAPSAIHLDDPYTEDPVITVAGDETGATITACTGREWKLVLGPSITLSSKDLATDSDFIVQERWDVAHADGKELHLYRTNARGDATSEAITWKELINHLCAQTIREMHPGEQG